MPRSCLGLRSFHILATGAITLGLSSGCELLVGELPQEVDSVGGTPGSSDGGTSNAGSGGRGTGSVATSDTGGRGGSAQGGNGVGGSVNGGAPSGSGGDEAGGRSGAGGQVGTGGVTSAGGQVATGGGSSTGGRAGNGGSPNTGGVPATGGAGACKNPPCDCDGDLGISTACSGGDDCDDADPLVYKDEPVYYATPSPRRGFDYDCSGAPDPDPLVNKLQACSDLLACNTTSAGFLGSIPQCGQTGDWGTCQQLPLPIGLTCSNKKTGTQQVLCK